MIRLLDRIFWSRYADEIAVKPTAKSSACFSGMFQVGIIVFAIVIGALAPLVRVINSLWNGKAVGFTRPVDYRAQWFVPMTAVSIMVTVYLMVSRYWKYKDASAEDYPFPERYDRSVMAAINVGLTLAAFGFMILMFRIFLR